MHSSTSGQGRVQDLKLGVAQGELGDLKGGGGGDGALGGWRKQVHWDTKLENMLTWGP